MAFTLMWMRGPLAMGSEEYDDLESATAHARDRMEQMQTRFGATAVKVVDEKGVPHFLKSISRD
ncbi:MAG TPA: hypothetical protein VIT45_12535 [Allosphingosinicella sp.]